MFKLLPGGVTKSSPNRVKGKIAPHLFGRTDESRSGVISS
jgi:hypothetical protein